jgi:hypothetical protein
MQLRTRNFPSEKTSDHFRPKRLRRLTMLPVPEPIPDNIVNDTTTSDSPTHDPSTTTLPEPIRPALQESVEASSTECHCDESNEQTSLNDGTEEHEETTMHELVPIVPSSDHLYVMLGMCRRKKKARAIVRMIVNEHILYTKHHDFYKIEPIPEEDDEAIPDRSVPSDSNSVHDLDIYYDANDDDNYHDEEFYNCSMEEPDAFYDCATEMEEIIMKQHDTEAITDQPVPSDLNSLHDLDFYYDVNNDNVYNDEELYNCSMEEPEAFYDCATETEEIIMKQRDSETIPDQSVPSDLNSLHNLDFYYDANNDDDCDDEEFYNCSMEELEAFYDCATETEEIIMNQRATNKSRRHAQNWGQELMIYNNNKISNESFSDNEQLLESEDSLTPIDTSPAHKIERSRKSRRQAQNWGFELMNYNNNIASVASSPAHDMEQSRKSRRQAKNWGLELMQYNNNKNETYDDSLCCNDSSDNDDENRDSIYQTSIDDEPIAPDVELDLVVEENFVPVVQEEEDVVVQLPVLPVVSPPLPQLRRSQRLANAAASRQTLPPLPPELRRSPRLALKPRVSYVGMC